LKRKGVIDHLTGDEPRLGVPGSGVRLTAQVKCVYTNTRSMGNKQEELEAIVQQDGYDLVAITETWWDNLHDWRAVMDGYRLFRKDRPTRRGGGVALYVKEQLECIELGLGAAGPCINKQGGTG